MRFNMFFVIGIAYISVFIGHAWYSVGTMSGPSEPFPWYMPLLVLVAVGTPFFIGYFAGRDED